LGKRRKSKYGMGGREGKTSLAKVTEGGGYIAEEGCGCADSGKMQLMAAICKKARGKERGEVRI